MKKVNHSIFENITQFFFIGLTILFSACESPQIEKIIEISPLVKDTNIFKTNPDNTEYNSIIAFTDLESCIGFAIPQNKNSAHYGGFIGPGLDHHGRDFWLSDQFLSLQILDENDSLIPWNAARDFNSYYVPGRLITECSIEGIYIKQELIFVEDKVTLTRISVQNQNTSSIHFNYSWRFQTSYFNGNFNVEQQSVVWRSENLEQIIMSRVSGKLKYFSSGRQPTGNPVMFNALNESGILLLPNEGLQLYAIVGVWDNQEDFDQIKNRRPWLMMPEDEFASQEMRWNWPD